MQKVIFLVDMNAFFISCEMTRNPKLQGKPAAVAGSPENRTGIILAANYEARKSGVKTAMVLHQALRLCPHLLLVPPDHNFYEKKSHEIMDVLDHYSPLVEKNSIDEAWLDMTGTKGLFGPPRKAAQKIMEDIRINLGLWCSIGISENKFLSKMASDMKKPLGITELWRKDVQKKMWPLPLKSMYGVGEKTAEKLHHMGIKTIGELAKLDPSYLHRFLGKNGVKLQQYANGFDLSPVSVNTTEDIKSIGRSVTLPEDLTDLESLRQILMELAEDIGRSARKYNKKGRHVQIVIRYADFKTITRQTTVSPTFYTNDIYRAGFELLKKNIYSSRAVRLIGITLKSFEEDPISQQLSFLQGGQEDKHEKIDQIMDVLRDKYGSDIVHRATLIKNSKNPQED